MSDAQPITEQPKVALSSIQNAVPNRLTRKSQNYEVEYGIRIDDDAVVFHFYPPEGGSWNQTYRMNDRLEKAIPAVFDISSVKAAYTEEYSSFCVIVRGLGLSADPWYLVDQFFEKIDAASV